MKKNKYLKETSWDRKVFGIKTYEMKNVSRCALESILTLKGTLPLKSIRKFQTSRFMIADFITVIP